ncbi:MAG: AI-2E family transporter [Clostridia bacterium]|nr:AI-2E family transporter [Clostridia bacterium]
MELNKSNVKRIIFIIFAAAAIFWAVMNYAIVISAIRWIIGVFSPLILGASFAFVINLLLRPIERGWDWLFLRKGDSPIAKKLKRPVSIFISIILTLGAIVAIFFIIIPEVTRTLRTIIDALPDYFEELKAWWKGISDFLAEYSIILPELEFESSSIIAKLTELVTTSGESIFNQTINTTTAIVSAIFNVFIGFAFCIYLLAGKERLIGQSKRTLIAAFSEKKAKRIFSFFSRVNDSFSHFVTGQVLEAIILGLLCFIGMLILGLPYASVVSVLVGVTALIPILGAYIGTAIGAFLILVESPIKALWFVLFIIVLQQLEGNLIYPHVVGKSVGLPGIWVLAAVTVGGNIYGVMGMLVSVPVCSVIYVYLSEKVRVGLKKRRGKAALCDPEVEAALAIETTANEQDTVKE